VPEAGPIEVIRLRDAVYCESCQCITRSTNGHCVACGGSGEAVVRVQAIFDKAQRDAPRKES
jgi:hypothetical protein